MYARYDCPILLVIYNSNGKAKIASLLSESIIAVYTNFRFLLRDCCLNVRELRLQLFRRFLLQCHLLLKLDDDLFQICYTCIPHYCCILLSKLL
ncbi:hypothetical protein D3C80_1498540 [compost metagenome]